MEAVCKSWRGKARKHFRILEESRKSCQALLIRLSYHLDSKIGKSVLSTEEQDISSRRRSGIKLEGLVRAQLFLWPEKMSLLFLKIYFSHNVFLYKERQIKNP